MPILCNPVYWNIIKRILALSLFSDSNIFYSFNSELEEESEVHYVLSAAKTTWHTANLSCISGGGDLATFPTAQKFTDFLNIRFSNISYELGR